MYYKIRENKREELQEGRTLQYIAQKCNYSRQYVTDFFNGRINITEDCAINILRGVSDDSIRIAIKINQEGFKNALNYFFTEVY